MSLLVWSWPCKIVSTYVFCVMLSHSFCCGTCMCTWSVLEKSVFFCCVCYFVWPRKYFGHIMLWVCCCQSVHNIICVLVDHDQSWIIDMELRLVLILCIVALPVSKQQTPICKNECYYFSYSWTKTLELFLSPDICPLVISHFDLLENHWAKLDQLWCDTPWVVLCQNVSGDIALHPRWCHNFWLVEKLKKKNWMEWNQILLNTPWIVSFQHCVSGFHHLSKMDTTADYAIFGFPAWSFLLKSDLTNILK